MPLIFSLPEHCVFSTPIQVPYTPQFSSRPPGSVCGCAERILTGPCSAGERANPILTQHIPQQSAPRCTSSGRLPGTAMGMHWPGPAGQGGDRGRGVMYKKEPSEKKGVQNDGGRSRLGHCRAACAGNPDIAGYQSTHSRAAVTPPARPPLGHVASRGRQVESLVGLSMLLSPFAHKNVIICSDFQVFRECFGHLQLIHQLKISTFTFKNSH